VDSNDLILIRLLWEQTNTLLSNIADELADHNEWLRENSHGRPTP
jgi:hypothetical protein